jgi:hypothetical protein
MYIAYDTCVVFTAVIPLNLRTKMLTMNTEIGCLGEVFLNTPSPLLRHPADRVYDVVLPIGLYRIDLKEKIQTPYRSQIK